MTALPDGFSTRPLTLDDSRAVFEIMAAQELADVGEVVIEEADLVADWQVPGFDLSTSSVGVVNGDALVAYAEVTDIGRGAACVSPDWLGRGLGTYLAGWMQECGRAKGVTTVGMPVFQGGPGDRLLEALGYHVRWTSWVLQLPAGAEISPRPLPEGYAVREARPEEYAAIHEVIEDAFLEWSDRPRTDYGYFDATVVRRPGFQPWNVRVAVAPGGEPVGAAVVLAAYDEGFVQNLATHRDHRNQGLAQALLLDSFAAAREHGMSRSALSTDSRTGALGLYEKVGMVVTQTWVNRAIDVT